MLLNSQEVDVDDYIIDYPYENLPDDQWFTPFIAKAYNLGILEETGDYYDPFDTKTRAEIAENLYRLLTN